MDSVIAGPIESFYTQDIKEVSSMGKKFSKTASSLESASSKMSKLHKGQTKYLEVNIHHFTEFLSKSTHFGSSLLWFLVFFFLNFDFCQAQSELLSAKQEHKKTTIEYVANLNKINNRKRVEMLERFTEFMLLQLTYFHQSYEYLKDIEPKLKQLRVQIQDERKQMDIQDRQTENLVQQLCRVRNTEISLFWIF